MYSSLELQIFSILSKKKDQLIYVFILVFSNDSS